MRIDKTLLPCIDQHGQVKDAYHDEVQAVYDYTDGGVEVVGQKAGWERNQTNEHEKNDVQPDAENIGFDHVVVIEMGIDPKGAHHNESQEENE